MCLSVVRSGGVLAETAKKPVFQANFSEQGAASEALVDVLLGNAMLMRDMLVAGLVQHTL